ncbi:MAG: STAS/SEC14 domain-containing protein [Thiolinea sp.]
MKEKLERHDKLNLLAVLGDEFGSYTAGAMWDDARLGFMHFTDFGKIALVTDIGWLRTSCKLLAPLMPAELQVFDEAQLEEAKGWVKS